jgi:mono/diheme cytochrome c family protein
MKTRVLLTLAVFVVVVGGCAQHSFTLPDGDPAAGRTVFSDLQCYGCHEVKGDEFPAPTTITPTYVALGATGTVQSRWQLFESVIAPSHQFAQPQPPVGATASEMNIMVGGRSKMTDYGDRLTVKQALDLVAYMEQLQKSGR